MVRFCYFLLETFRRRTTPEYYNIIKKYAGKQIVLYIVCVYYYNIILCGYVTDLTTVM